MVVERNYMVIDLPTDFLGATSPVHEPTHRQDSRFPVEINFTACVKVDEVPKVYRTRVLIIYKNKMILIRHIFILISRNTFYQIRTLIQ